jgi:hypothetical protein
MGLLNIPFERRDYIQFEQLDVALQLYAYTVSGYIRAEPMTKTYERSVMQHVLCFVFSLIYKRWLYDDYSKSFDTVVKVKGWRTALVDSKGGSRRSMSPCFWIFE